MQWTSHLGVVLLVAMSVRCVDISALLCASNDDCLPHGCCLASFVEDKEAKCELLGKSGDPCETTLSVSVPGAEGGEVAAKNKYLGHCPCGEGLDCTKVQNGSRCTSSVL